MVSDTNSSNLAQRVVDHLQVVGELIHPSIKEGELGGHSGRERLQVSQHLHKGMALGR